jgi:glycosyltransferase involved in cell wall biosynthesis
VRLGSGRQRLRQTPLQEVTKRLSNRSASASLQADYCLLENYRQYKSLLEPFDVCSSNVKGQTLVTAVAFYFHRLSKAGGAERMISQVTDMLSGRGLDVHLISLDAPSAQSFYPIGNRVNWHRLGLSNGAQGKVQRIQTMATIIRRHKIRVLVGFVMSGDKTVYAASQITGVRLVAAERNGPSMYRFRCGSGQRWLRFALLYLCDAITVQFPDYVQGYPSWLQKRMTCIANPVSPPQAIARPEFPNKDGRYQVLAVSRLDELQKRLDCLIHAFSRIAPLMPNWDLKIIGEGQDEPALRKLVSSFALEARVAFEVPTKCIHDAYGKANLFVMPSRWEGFPNALAEALSAGLPAVGFRNAEGVAQLISHGSTGWLADRGNEIDALACTLHQAMSDGEERRRRGALAAREMRKYEPEEQFQRWATLIEGVANGRKI